MPHRFRWDTANNERQSTFEPMANAKPVSTILICLLLALTSRASAQMRVGFIGDFSGAERQFGEACRNGFELAQQDADTGLKVFFEDHGNSAAKAVAAFQNLVSLHQIEAVIVLGSTPSNAVAPLAQTKGIPLFAWAGSNTGSKGRSFVLRTWTDSADEGKRLAEVIHATGQRRVGLLYTQDDYTTAVANGFKEALPAAQLVDFGPVAPSERDFRTLVAKLKEQKITDMAICLLPGQSSAVALQAQQLGLEIPLWSCETLNSVADIAAAGSVFDGAKFISIGVDASFAARYTRQFGSETGLAGAAIHYDLFNILRDLSSRNVRGAEMMTQVDKLTDVNGALGVFSVTSKNGDRYLALPLVLKEIRNGEVILADDGK